MRAFVLRRLGAAAILLFLVLTATFALLHLAPGDPVALLGDPRVPESQRQELRQLWGLDRSLAEQYLSWLGQALRGDWGTSRLYHLPATQVVARALPATLLLGAAALAVQLGIAVPLGILAARRRRTWIDRSLRVVSLGVYSLPTFWLGLMALLLFSYRRTWFPSSHLSSVGAADWSLWNRGLDLVWHLALPALVLGVSAAGGWLRLVRSGVLEQLGREHLQAARARGITESRLLGWHVLRGAVGPLAQVLGVTLPALLSGALVTEVVFGWPGLGRATYAALVARDYALVLTGTAWSAVLVIFGSVLADLLHAAADPRVRDEG